MEQLNTDMHNRFKCIYLEAQFLEFELQWENMIGLDYHAWINMFQLHCAELLGDKVQVYDTSMNDNIITNANS